MQFADLAGDIPMTVAVPPTAAGTEVEVPVLLAPNGVKITGVWWVPGADMAADAANHVTLEVRNRGRDNSGERVAATRSYATAAGTANVAEPVQLSGSEADLLGDAGDVITAHLTHTGTGQAIPAGLVQITYRSR